jgi:protocatechuate 3,4-dioxygenase beta subunit
MNASRTTTRRQLIARAAATGTAFVVLPDWIAGLGQATPALATAGTGRLTPELTEGPYWVDTMLRRSDVRANTPGAKTAPGVAQDGVSLELTINVLEGGEPLSGVAVDIWHANAHGLYSDESSQSAGGGTSGGDTSGQNYLRGYQITGEDRGINAAPVAGQVSFATIWPAGTRVARSTFTCVYANCPSRAPQSPATRPRSSSPTPTTTRF